MIRGLYFWLRDRMTAELYPRDIPTKMNFGPEAEDLQRKREEIKVWMREKGIAQQPVGRLEKPYGEIR